MEAKTYLHILPPEGRKAFSSFLLYMPAGDGHHTLYQFAYEENPPKPELAFHRGANDPANRAFYRICEAYVVKKEGDGFRKLFRALQKGEIGFAMREAGSGDAVGGYHGDEILTAARLVADGRELDLKTPFFGAVEAFSFYQQSHIFQCNTPSQKLLLHTQEYTVQGNTLKLSQDILWLAEGRQMRISSPMLTVQRLDPELPNRILTDTVEFYGPDGGMVAFCDTSPYGTENPVPVAKADNTISACQGTHATSARVYGKESGLCAETGFTVRNSTIPAARREAFLCIRFMPHTLDNKIYFRTFCDTCPPKGTRWQTEHFYRITYRPIKRKEDDHVFTV